MEYKILFGRVGEHDQESIVEGKDIGPKAVIDRLLKLGAIEKVVPAPEPIEDEAETAPDDIHGMTIKALAEVAAAEGIENPPKSRGGLIKAIEKARAEAGA